MDKTRLIFCASPGRCGTKYLAEMLSLVPGVVARHEPPPHFSLHGNGDVESKLAFAREKKLPEIRRLLNQGEASIYIETDHAFIKGFYRAFLDLNAPFDLIVLTRPHREVALSLWRRGSIPGRTKRGRRALCNPHFAVRPIRHLRSLTDYQLCYWHCLETAARSEMAAGLVLTSGRIVHRTSLTQIVTRGGFQSLLTDLGLPDPNWDLFTTRAVNRTSVGLRDKYPSEDLGRAEQDLILALRGGPNGEQGKIH